jgi:hypothetical protein
MAAPPFAPAGKAPPKSSPGADPAAEASFEVLLRGVLGGDADAIKRASEEDVRRLQDSLNPYNYVISGGERPNVKKAMACSYTNLREEYVERFTMTSLIAFLFRMYREWEVPDETRRWDPAAVVGGEAPRRAPALRAQELVDKAEAALAAAKEALEAEKVSQASTMKAAEADVLREAAALGEKLSPQAMRDIEMSDELGAKATTDRGMADGLLYIAHRIVVKHGQVARDSLVSAAIRAEGHPEVADLVARDPLVVEARTNSVPAPVAKEIIGQFLRTWFEFDPDAHVRKAYDEVPSVPGTDLPGAAIARADAFDPERIHLQSLKGVVTTIPDPYADAYRAATDDRRTFDATKAVLANSRLVSGIVAAVVRAPGDKATSEPSAIVNVESLRTLRALLSPIAPDDEARGAVDVVPPADTFHRWQYYRDVNYEALRVATEALYGDKPDMEFAFAWFDTFEGSGDEVDAAFAKYKKLHADELRSPLFSVTGGGWTLMGPWQENRARIDFYNKNTKVLERIIARHEEDAKLGADLMRKRVIKVKAKNIAKDGPDSSGLSEYRSTLGSSAGEAVIDAKTMSAMARAKGDLAKVREIKDFSALEDEMAGLLKKKKFRPWTSDEAARVEELDVAIARAKEMLEVPDDGIQVDIFEHDGAAGKFVKKHFYTKAEEPESSSVAPAAGGAGDAAGGAGDAAASAGDAAASAGDAAGGAGDAAASAGDAAATPSAVLIEDEDATPPPM